jgi:microcystin-dependent protein
MTGPPDLAEIAAGLFHRGDPMAFWKWSRTASSNATADNTVNWAEGMAPSAVNDSARAMMARLAEWRDDVSGTIVTAGSSTAYTLASNQGFDNFPDLGGAMIAFVPHATNAASPTLNVDGLGAKPLRFGPTTQVNEIQSGVLIQGTPYVASYNNSDGAFYLQGGFANPYGIPLGGLLPYIGSSAPNSAFVLPFGQAISRTTYATLFSLVSTTFGAGDGSTTFNVPDLRGRSIFGQDNMGGSAASRITVAGGNFDGTVLGGTGGGQNKVIANSNLPASIPYNDPGHSHVVLARSTGNALGAQFAAGSVGNAMFDIGLTGGLNSSTNSGTTGIAINLGGANTALPVMPPAMVLPYILRVI